MKYLTSVLGVLFMMLVGVTVANAALPLVIATTITDMQTDALAIIDLIWPFVGIITGSFLLFKIFKRGTAKV